MHNALTVVKPYAYNRQMWEIIEPKYGKRIHERTIDTLHLLHTEGKTLEQLGYFLGVSRERIRQLFEAEGFSPTAGGRSVRKLNRNEALKAKQLASQKKTEARMEAIFRCPYGELVAICGRPVNFTTIQAQGSPHAGYYSQLRNANSRGIGWEITFPEWWRVWQESGHWNQRGRGKANYCMSRDKDEGPYRVGNVKIITNLQNTSSGQTKFARHEKQRDELGLTRLERAVYDYIQAGYSSPTVIGEKLSIKAETVQQIKQNLKHRLGVFNGIQLGLK